MSPPDFVSMIVFFLLIFFSFYLFCVTTRLCEYDSDEVGNEDENGLLMQIIMKPWDHMREMTITKLMVPDQEKR